jgi:hypothetical protein
MSLHGTVMLNERLLVTWTAHRLENRKNEYGNLYEWEVTKQHLGTTQREPEVFKGRLRHKSETGAMALARAVLGSAMIVEIARAEGAGDERIEL